jgi:arylsulfatase A-like enzyme
MNERPNIVMVHCHDLGQHLGCYGVGTVTSPHLDALAGEGVVFTHSFCAAPQCSPSRAALWTGRFPHSNGVMGLCHARYAWDLHPTERHLAGRLQEAGYRTGLVGVRHETRRPEAMGFSDLLGEGTAAEVAGTAVDYLRELGRGDQPFYAQIGFFEPHRPFGEERDDSQGVTVPPYLVDESSARDEFAAFQGAIRRVDGQIGRICAALDEFGLRENTLVIFTADHGIPFPRAKCSLYDPGLQVPLIVRWPARGWEGGKRCAELISNVDYVPTLLEAIGLPVPANLQGRSFLPLLEGGDYQPREEIFAEMTYHEYYDPLRAIRTARHKLIANFCAAPFFMDPSQTWRPATRPRYPEDPANTKHPPLELYDLVADPGEAENLAGRAEVAEVQRDLMRRLWAWMKETADPLLEGVPLSPAHVGALEALRGA